MDRLIQSQTAKFDAEQEPEVLHQGKYRPIHEGQRKAWVTARRFIAIFAGWRSGKTEIGPPWLLREMQRMGAGDYAVIGPTYPIIDNKARPALKRFINKSLGLNAYHSSGDIWTLTDFGCRRLFGHVPEIETRILFRHGKNADAIEAFDGLAIWTDEPGQMEDELNEAMEARVSISQGRILYTSRPFKFNYYVTKIWNRVMDKLHRRRSDAPEDTEVINFSSKANPAFSDEEWESQKAKLPGWKFDLKYRGIPTKPAGVIYECFDREKCTVKVKIGEDWQRAAGHDFGSRNTAGVWAARHPQWKTDEGEPVWILYSTYHQDATRTTEEHILNFLYGTQDADADDWEEPDHSTWRVSKKRNREDGSWKPILPWSWGGNVTGDDGWRGDYTTNGYTILAPPENDVDKGIECVHGWLKTGRLLISAELENIIKDLEEYSYEVDEEGELVLGENGKPKIDQKSKWHLMDSLRYLCLGLEPGDLKIRVYGSSNQNKEDQEERELVRLVLGEEEAKKVYVRKGQSERVTSISKPRVSKW